MENSSLYLSHYPAPTRCFMGVVSSRCMHAAERAGRNLTLHKSKRHFTSETVSGTRREKWHHGAGNQQANQTFQLVGRRRIHQEVRQSYSSAGCASGRVGRHDVFGRKLPLHKGRGHYVHRAESLHGPGQHRQWRSRGSVVSLCVAQLGKVDHVNDVQQGRCSFCVVLGVQRQVKMLAAMSTELQLSMHLLWGFTLTKRQVDVHELSFNCH